MKKQVKFVIALAVSLLCCINTGVSIFTVSASSNQQINTSSKKVISGGVQGEFTWILNTVTGQLRVKVSEGVPYPIDDHPSWSMYKNQIRKKMIADTSLWKKISVLGSFDQHSGNFSIQVDGEKYTGKLDWATQTFTIYGKGELPFIDWSYAGLGNSVTQIKHVVLANGIDSYNDNIRSIPFNFPFAETVSGYVNPNVRWEQNLQTDVLTISGKGDCIVNGLYAPWPGTETFSKLIIEDGITSFTESDLEVEEMVLGKDIKQPYIRGAKLKSYKVDPQNPYLADYDGVLYSKDYKNLIRCPTNKTIIKFHPNTQVIKEGAFDHTNLTSPIVFPWGLQKVEDPIFNNRVDAVTVVLPDTLLPGQRTGAFHTTLYCSTKKQADIVPFQSDSDDVCIVDDKTTYDYYGVKPNSLHTFENGKTYCFGPNYEYAKGWKQASGNWYYFNDYGAAVVKIWLKSGNKWYFMQADGTMATNKWIQWYNKWYYMGSDGAMYANRWIKSSGKWYYLGSDGAMYTNRYTPDGCWVNGSGAWVK